MNPVYLELIVVGLGIALLMGEAFAEQIDKRVFGCLAIAGLAVVFLLTFFTNPDLPEDAAYASYYAVDPLAMFFKRFALLSTILVLVMAVEYAPVIERFVPGAKKGDGVGEFFSLPLLTCAGLMWMASATDFIVIFVALELVTVSFYVLVSYMRRSRQCLEAGVKYLILGALSTGFIVYGITWIFGVTGETNLTRIMQAVAALPESAYPSLLFGIGLVLVALGFKIAAAPFQFWVPDVYQGAPTPITAFLSVGSKAAGFVVLVRVIEPFLVVPVIQARVVNVLAVLSAATLIYGNLAAMPQTNMKRLLSYSSIAHAGYLLMGVASVGALMAGPGIVFYLAAYLLMTFSSFLVLLLVGKAVGGDDIVHFQGLAKRSPWLAAAMLIAMLSLAGIPFTAGFLGKFFVFEAAVEQRLFWLVGIGAITVGCGFYYYLKVVRAMYWQAAPDGAAAIGVSKLATATLAGLAILILVLGIYPQPILAALN